MTKTYVRFNDGSEIPSGCFIGEHGVKVSKFVIEIESMDSVTEDYIKQLIQQKFKIKKIVKEEETTYYARIRNV